MLGWINVKIEFWFHILLSQYHVAWNRNQELLISLRIKVHVRHVLGTRIINRNFFTRRWKEGEKIEILKSWNSFLNFMVWKTDLLLWTISKPQLKRSKNLEQTTKLTVASNYLPPLDFHKNLCEAGKFRFRICWSSKVCYSKWEWDSVNIKHLQIFVNPNVIRPKIIKTIELVRVDHGEREHWEANDHNPKYIHHFLPNAPWYLKYKQMKTGLFGMFFYHLLWHLLYAIWFISLYLNEHVSIQLYLSICLSYSDQTETRVTIWPNSILNTQS